MVKTKPFNMINEYICYFCSYLFLRNNVVTNMTRKSSDICTNNSDITLDALVLKEKQPLARQKNILKRKTSTDKERAFRREKF